MRPDRLHQIREVFEQVLQLPWERRKEFLRELSIRDPNVHSDVERLLVAHESPTASIDIPAVLPAAAIEGAEAKQPDEPQDPAGQRFGAYEVVRRLGRGGMGDVYLARRADQTFTKYIALKIVRPGVANDDVIQRFRQEREILAPLEHPNIARLLDGGSTGAGLPYFAMEYVQGQRIDEFCDDHKLSVRERLELFQQVCAAVEYAHEKRVVHRDLKPTNILVTDERTVKLLDFGIAKILGSAGDQTAYVTRTGQHAMTPEYASPEQIKGERITAATDVYALGVVLYELLTGRRPYRLTSRIYHEIARVICEEEPTHPSTAVGQPETQAPAVVKRTPEKPVTPGQLSRLRQETPSDLKRLLAGDLDHIVLKALRKDPERRYTSAAQLREDIHRHLAGEAVLAKGPSVLDSMVKFIRRHLAPAVASAVLAVLVASGAVIVEWPARLFLIGFSGSLALGYVMRRLEWGKRMAERDVGTHAVFLVICLLSVTILFVWLPSRQRDRAMVLLNLTMIVSLTIFFLGFALRPGRAGRLLLDLSQPMRKTKITTAAVLLPALGMQVIGRFKLGQLASWPFATYFAGMLLYTVYQLLYLGQLQLRERGVMHLGQFVPWQRILSYRWESDRGDFGILRVRVKRLMNVLPPARWMVPHERKAEVDAVLGKQFSEWSTD